MGVQPAFLGYQEDCDLKQFLAATSKQFLAASFTKTREYRAHNCSTIGTFGTLHCRKCKEEVKCCRKFAEGVVDPVSDPTNYPTARAKHEGPKFFERVP
jgi:hypothetical protein